MRSRFPSIQAVAAEPILLFATLFGAGLFRAAPGSAGTALAVPFGVALAQLGPAVYLAALAAISVAGIWICRKAAQALKVHDHPAIVWDELAGYLVTMSPSLWGLGQGAPAFLAGFILFRVFDILKPWPIRAVDRRVTGGLGVMADDLLAGVYAAAVLMGGAAAGLW